MKEKVVNVLSGAGFVCVCAQAWSRCTRPDRKNSHENFCILLSVININADISTTELETNCESGRD